MKDALLKLPASLPVNLEESLPHPSSSCFAARLRGIEKFFCKCFFRPRAACLQLMIAVMDACAPEVQDRIKKRLSQPVSVLLEAVMEMSKPQIEDFKSFGGLALMEKVWELSNSKYGKNEKKLKGEEEAFNRALTLMNLPDSDMAKLSKSLNNDQEPNSQCVVM